MRACVLCSVFRVLFYGGVVCVPVGVSEHPSAGKVPSGKGAGDQGNTAPWSRTSSRGRKP
eukprot:2026036-Amphidinium_carterae.1